MNQSVPAKFGILNRFLNVVERLGNKLPHITMLFIYALIFTMTSVIGFILCGF